MYPKNAASPPRIPIGAVVQISDGAVQTSGVSVKVLPEGGTASAGGGTVGYEEGVVHYVPTQAETNYTEFILIAYKTGCIPASVGVVTTDSATAGRVNVASIAGTAQTARDLGAQLDAAVTTRLASASYSAPLDAAGTRTAVGLAAANLDTQLSAIAAYIDTEVASILSAVTSGTYGTAALKTLIEAIKAKTDSLAFTTAGQVDARVMTALDSSGITTLLTRIVGTLAAGTHNAQSGDAYARLGAPAGASHAADVAAVKTVVDAVKPKTDGLNFTGTDVKATLDGETVTVGTNSDKTGYSVGTGGITAASFAAGAIDAAAIAASAIGAAEIAAGAIDADALAADVEVKANVTKINSTTLTGNGSTTPWGPA